VSEHPQDHFSEVAGRYAEFRPRYPAPLFRWLADIAPGRRLAWDAGTGNGQAAVALAEYFDHVVATDFSEGQIASAMHHPQVEYQVRPSDHSGLPVASADLVTAAQALHWFDTDRFFEEVGRVLRPGGVIAAWSYGVVHGDEEILDRTLHQFYYDEIGPWWPENRKLVEEGYRTIAFPFTRIEAPALQMIALWRLDQLTGYIGTWSAVSRYRAAFGRDPVPDLSARLAEHWGSPQTVREIRWPLSVIAGVKGER
jgi:SAM-dependent methyltransferase